MRLWVRDAAGLVAAIWVMGIYGANLYLHVMRAEARVRALLASLLGCSGCAW
jgi:hypothetical protein